MERAERTRRGRQAHCRLTLAYSKFWGAHEAQVGLNPAGRPSRDIPCVLPSNGTLHEPRPPYAPIMIRLRHLCSSTALFLRPLLDYSPCKKTDLCQFLLEHPAHTRSGSFID